MNFKRLLNHPLFLLFAVYAAAGFVIYSRVIMQGQFIFDDYEYVMGNSIIQDFSVLLNNYSDPRQLGYFTFALNYLAGGEDPLGFHLVNVIIHICNGIIVYFIARLLIRFCGVGADEQSRDFGFWIAATAGMIFMVHPLQTQAVSYVSQRFTSLAAFFYLLSIHLYFSARLRMSSVGTDSRAKMLYVAAFISIVAAMKVKEISFTAPFMIAIIDLLFLRSPKDRASFPYLIAPFMAAVVIIPFSILGPDWGLIDSGMGIAEVTRKEKIYDLTQRPVVEYFATQLRVLIIYMRLVVFPYPQTAVYNLMASRSFLELVVILSAIFHIAVMALSVFCWKRADKAALEKAPFLRLIALGFGWFYLAASVESSFIPIKDLAFEHRAYLPGVGIILAGLSAAVLLWQKLPSFSGKTMKTLAYAAVSVVAVLSITAFVRNNVWLNELNFWDDVVAKIPDKAIGYHNRGNARARAGQYDLAISDINRTISFFENYIGKQGTWETSDFTPTNMAKTYMNRASVHRAMGKMELAAADDETARRMVSMPAIDLEGTRKAAEIFYKRGAYKHAIDEYGKIISWFPSDVNALNDRGNAYSMTGSYKESLADFEAVIKLAPEWPLPYHNRGVARIKSNDRKGAVEDFEKACKMGLPQSCDSIAELKKETETK